MQPRIENTARLLATVGVIGGAIALAVNREFYDSALVSAYFCLALLGTLFFLFAVRPLSDAVYVLECAGGLALLSYFVRHLHFYFVALLSLVGLSALLVLALRAIWSTNPDRKGLLYAFVPAVLFVFSEWSATSMLDLTGRLHPKTLDLYLYSFDCSLGLQPSFLIGQLFRRFEWLRVTSLIFYVGLPLPLAITYGRQLKARGAGALPVIAAYLITGPLGILFYNIFPATGPVHVFLSRFPLHPLTLAEASRLALEPIAVAGYRNAIPSLHMTWVLLAWWNSKGLSRLTRTVALAFVLFTILSTLGTGEHYLVDLVVACPFALFVNSLADYRVPLRDSRRSIPVLCGLMCSLTWLGLLSFGLRVMWLSPIIPWLLIVGTVIGATVLDRWTHAPTGEPEYFAGALSQEASAP